MAGSVHVQDVRESATKRRGRCSGSARIWVYGILVALFALAGWAGWIVASSRGRASADVEWAPPGGQVHDVGLSVRSIGSGRPTIVLLHGLTGSHRYFGEAYDALAEDGHVVVPNLLGFGDSPRPEDSSYDADAHARSVLVALEQLGAEPPMYVAAHSAGTLVALRLAAMRPDWFRVVLVFGPPIYPSEEAARAHIGALSGMVRFFAMDTVWARAACWLGHEFPGLSARFASAVRPDLPEPIAHDVLDHSWTSYSRTLRNLLLDQPPRDLRELKLPVHFIFGAEDEVVDRDYLEQIARAPQRTLEIWRGGHDLPLTDAQRAVAAIRSVMAQDADRVSPDGDA